MGMAVRMNVAAFKEQLRAKVEVIHAATRPAAQAGAQIIYERARINAPVSGKEHFFYIRGRKYGPYAPGNLRDSVYQVFSKDQSFRDLATYEISWNKTRAPYGFLAEFGSSTRPAVSFIGRSVVETRPQAREAMKQRFLEEVNK